MHQHLTERKTHAENMQISFYFCKTCICLKILENIQISVNMIDRLDITDEYSVKCEFILKTVIFIDAALHISLRKFWKCNILWFSYLAEGFRMRPKVWSTLTVDSYLSNQPASWLSLQNTYGKGRCSVKPVWTPPPPNNLLLTVPRWCFCCGLF